MHELWVWTNQVVTSGSLFSGQFNKHSLHIAALNDGSRNEIKGPTYLHWNYGLRDKYREEIARCFPLEMSSLLLEILSLINSFWRNHGCSRVYECVSSYWVYEYMTRKERGLWCINWILLMAVKICLPWSQCHVLTTWTFLNHWTPPVQGWTWEWNRCRGGTWGCTSYQVSVQMESGGS